MQRVLNITDKVKWIGVLDKDLVTFDIVMETKFGSTYNSYFINADKKTIVETVKEKFFNEYIEKINSQIKLAEIDYIILNHTEPDHSGSLKHLLKLAPKAVVVGSRLAISYMEDFIGYTFPHMIVKDGDELDLGNMTIKFIGAANLHWPDTLYSYLQEEKILFTCDSFGAHYADERMFDDLIGNYDEALKYYFDVILKPYSRFMLKAIEKIRLLDIRAICTGHGPLLTSNWQRVVDLSEKWAKEYMELSSKRNVFIAYVSAYGNTKLLAEKIGEIISKKSDFNPIIADVEHMTVQNIEDNLIKSSAILIGSPTINQNTLLPIYNIFACINPIRDKGKVAAAFGSYGWSGEAAKIISDNLRNLKLNVQEPFTFKFSPHSEIFEKCSPFVDEFISELKKCDSKI
jgi:flavorubredoxin